MQYMLMIHADESAMTSMTPDAIQSVMVAMDRFDAEITEKGQNLGSIRLQPATTAKTVRVRKGKALKTDGPFAETKEVIGGVYLIEAANEDEALDIATRLPTATFCTIEVRPILGIDIRRAVSAGV
jgi:hypothetical protein